MEHAFRRAEILALVGVVSGHGLSHAETETEPEQEAFRPWAEFLQGLKPVRANNSSARLKSGPDTKHFEIEFQQPMKPTP